MTERKPSMQKFRNINPRIDYYPCPDAHKVIERLKQANPNTNTRELIDALVMAGEKALFPEIRDVSKS